MRTQGLASEVLRVEELERFVLVVGDDAQNLGSVVEELLEAVGVLHVPHCPGELLVDEMDGALALGEVSPLIVAEQSAQHAQGEQALLSVDHLEVLFLRPLQQDDRAHHVGLVWTPLLRCGEIRNQLTCVLRSPGVRPLEVGDPQWGPPRTEQVLDGLELQQISIDRHGGHGNKEVRHRGAISTGRRQMVLGRPLIRFGRCESSVSI